jgi:hypothetical protein
MNSSYLYETLKIMCSERDRAVVQTVIHWLPTAMARVRAQVMSCGICVGQSSTGCRFSPSFLHRMLHTRHHHLLSGDGTIGQIVADAPSGLSHTPSQAFICLETLRTLLAKQVVWEWLGCKKN